MAQCTLYWWLIVTPLHSLSCRLATIFLQLDIVFGLMATSWYSISESANMYNHLYKGTNYLAWYISHNESVMVNSYKYLGIWCTPTPNWSMNVSEVLNKARQQVGILNGRFYHRTNSSTLVQLLLSLYSSASWICSSGMGLPSAGTSQFPWKGADYLCTSTKASRRHCLKLCFLYYVIALKSIALHRPHHIVVVSVDVLACDLFG